MDSPFVPLDIAAIAREVPAFRLHYEPVIPSTNSLAMASVTKGMIGANEVILTDAQPEGRGRQGRSWVTLPGKQILISVILTPTFPPHRLVMAASVAALTALEAVGIDRERLSLKWPNDLLIDDLKVAGILIETTTNSSGQLAAVIGMGMNVNGSLLAWPEVAARATTLETAMRQPLAREAIIIVWLQRLREIIDGLTADVERATLALHHEWRSRLVTIGRPTSVHQATKRLNGVAEGVDGDGALLLRLDDGALHTITWGDVESSG